MISKLLWLDCRKYAKEEIMNLLHLNYDFYLISIEQLLQLKGVLSNCIVFVSELEALESIGTDYMIMSNNFEVLSKAVTNGNKTVIYDEINDYVSLSRMVQLGKLFPYSAVQFNDSTNIPLELLIATFQNNNTQLLKFVSSHVEMRVVSAVMEKGSEGIIVSTDSMEEIKQCSALKDELNQDKINLEIGKVTSIEHIGNGCRVCVDTTSMLKENEGMLVGSTAVGGILVSSETHYLPYMELRPFRVNAGAIHSYVWNNEKTSYLSELKSGSSVWCVDTEGNTRKVCVGRAKTEIRPLLKIEVSIGEQTINTIVQDDWHIRILGPNNTVLNATSLCIGDEVLAYSMGNARHVGINIHEYLSEK